MSSFNLLYLFVISIELFIKKIHNLFQEYNILVLLLKYTLPNILIHYQIVESNQVLFYHILKL